MKLNYYFLITIIASTIVIAQDDLSLLTSISGENRGDEFSNVVGLGDVNNDGFDDFIVGSSRGQYAKLYFGGSPFDTLNFLKYTYEESGYQVVLGGSFAGSGDLNGDGINDFVMATSSYEFVDQIRIFFGGTNIGTEADLIINSPLYRISFGGSISINGDLNNDGFDDLVVGAANDFYDAHGRVYIYFGNTDMVSEYDLLFEGEEEFDMFGGPVALVGDTNQDGYSDLLIGAQEDLKYNRPGKAYLFFGGDNMGFDHSSKFIGDSTTYLYGRYLSGLGDINGDGFSDIGISSDQYIELILGNSIKNDLLSVKINSEHGYSVIGTLNDLNDDGIDDFVSVTSKTKFYFGNAELDTIPEITLDHWSNCVINLGDINSDGLTEIGIGIAGGYHPEGIVNIYSYGKPDKLDESLEDQIPSDFKLFLNYPNPFNPTTTITYQLYKRLDVSLEVYSIAGEEVKTIVKQNQSAGNYSIRWNGDNDEGISVSSGVYIIKFTVINENDKKSLQQKMMKTLLLK